jgi:hypothetical protein
MDTRFSHKKGRDKVQQQKYVELHNQIARIMQKHPEGLYRNEIQTAINNERKKANETKKLTLVTLRKHLSDFINNEKYVIETDISPSDGSKLSRRRLFWAFQYDQFRIMNDCMRHWVDSLQQEYNDYVIEKKSTKIQFSDAVNLVLETTAFVFIPVKFDRNGLIIRSYFLEAVPLEEMSADASTRWKTIIDHAKQAMIIMKNNPNRKSNSSLRDWQR